MASLVTSTVLVGDDAQQVPVCLGPQPKMVDMHSDEAAPAGGIDQMRRRVLVDWDSLYGRHHAFGSAPVPVRQAGLRGRPRRGCALA